MTTLLIDGYNFIWSSKDPLLASSKDLEKERLTLVHKLSQYKQFKKHAITVVFDGTHSDHLYQTEEKIAGIKLIFSERGQTADQVIIELSRKLKDQALVVSSDNEILRAARQAGSGILKADEFEKKINEALLYSQNENPEAPELEKNPVHKRWITMKKGPSKRLPKAKRRALSKLKNI